MKKLKQEWNTLIANVGLALNILGTLSLEVAHLRADVNALRSELNKLSQRKPVPLLEPESPEQLAKRHGLPDRFGAIVDWERMP